MHQTVRDFLSDESGAATVDWVVLTAATVGLGVAVMGEVQDGVEALSREIDSFLRADLIRTSFDEPLPGADYTPTPGNGEEAGEEDGG